MANLVKGYEIDLLPAELVVGKFASLVNHPTIVGHITAVHVFNAGRTYSFAWFSEVDESFRSADVDAFQLELIDDQES